LFAAGGTAFGTPVDSFRFDEVLALSVLVLDNRVDEVDIETDVLALGKRWLRHHSVSNHAFFEVLEEVLLLIVVDLKLLEDLIDHVRGCIRLPLIAVVVGLAKEIVE
jgi:hypothetical protein